MQLGKFSMLEMAKPSGHTALKIFQLKKYYFATFSSGKMDYLGGVVRVQHKVRTWRPEADSNLRPAGPSQRRTGLRRSARSEEVLQPNLPSRRW